MSLSIKPLVVSCLVRNPPEDFIKDCEGVLVVKRLWNGIERLGLPTADFSETETVEGNAWKLISPNNIAIVRSLGQGWHLGGSERYEWNGRLVALNIYDFKEAVIVAPMSAQATYVSLPMIVNSNVLDPIFDVTVILLRELLRKRIEKSIAA